MKKLRHIMLLLSALFFVNSYGMQRVQQNSPLRVYFSPQEQAEITNELYSLLDGAKKQILIAIYWITDKNLIEKFIAAKNRNVDVQIVIDASTPDINNITKQLLKSGIVPAIYPSDNRNAAGKMHNKFAIVDAEKVFTGSANFTPTALNPNAKNYNFENVVLINSADIAQKFINAFMRMEQDIFDFYVDIVALSSLDQLPDWMHNTLPSIYQRKNSMQSSVRQLSKNYNAEEQKRINSFFGIQFAQQKEPITENQLRLLRTKGLPDKEILGLSKQEASPIIGKILAMKLNWDPATDKQRSLLRDMGMPNTEALALSKQEASSIKTEAELYAGRAKA